MTKRNESHNSNMKTAGWKNMEIPWTEDKLWCHRPQFAPTPLLYNKQLKHPGFAIFKGEIWKAWLTSNSCLLLKEQFNCTQCAQTDTTGFVFQFLNAFSSKQKQYFNFLL